jgi:hypothetical protein
MSHKSDGGMGYFLLFPEEIHFFKAGSNPKMTYERTSTDVEGALRPAE